MPPSKFQYVVGALLLMLLLVACDDASPRDLDRDLDEMDSALAELEERIEEFDRQHVAIRFATLAVQIHDAKTIDEAREIAAQRCELEIQALNDFMNERREDYTDMSTNACRNFPSGGPADLTDQED